MMTRRDYRIIATALDQARSTAFDHDPATVKSVAALLAAHLHADNPRFDAARFFDACGQRDRKDDPR